MNAVILTSTIMLLAQAGPNTDGINGVLTGSLDAMVNNFSQVQSASQQVLISLLAIEFAVLLIYHMINPNLEELLKNLIQKFFMAIVVIFLTLNWGWFAGAVRGYIVGGAGGGQTMSQGLHPGAIAESGIQKVAVIFNDPERLKQISRTFTGNEQKEKPKPPKKPESDSIFDLEGKLPDVGGALEQMGQDVQDTLWGMVALLIFTILAMIVVFVHFYVALQVFVIMLEFYIITSITACCIPFAANKHTSYLATGAINSVVASCVKLAVLMMIIGMMGDPIQQMTLSNSPTMYEMLALILNTATMAFIVKQAPSIAQATFSGGGAGIDVGSMVSSAGATMAAAASVGATGAQGVAAVGKLGAQGAIAGATLGAQGAAWGLGKGTEAVSKGISHMRAGMPSLGGASSNSASGASAASQSGGASSSRGQAAQAGQPSGARARSGAEGVAAYLGAAAYLGLPTSPANSGPACSTGSTQGGQATKKAACDFGLQQFCSSERGQADGQSTSQSCSPSMERADAQSSRSASGQESQAASGVSRGSKGQPSAPPRPLPTVTVEALPQVPSSQHDQD